MQHERPQADTNHPRSSPGAVHAVLSMVRVGDGTRIKEEASLIRVGFGAVTFWSVVIHTYCAIEKQLRARLQGK